MPSIKTIFQSTANLFFPHLCSGCGSDTLTRHEILCNSCINSLTHTEFEKHSNNPIEKIFIGRVPIEAAHSQFYFSKGEMLQNLVHEFKYKGNTDIGLYLSEIMGKKMQESNRYNEIDYLIPLPLFADKEYKRGFNQAAVICDGIALAMNVKVLKNIVTRIKFTETQTKKHRTERWENVAESFNVEDKKILEHKHVCLIDDVITTGATLDACAQKIIAIPGAKISIATLTTASK
jgi:ComF family protein